MVCTGDFLLSKRLSQLIFSYARIENLGCEGLVCERLGLLGVCECGSVRGWGCWGCEGLVCERLGLLGVCECGSVRGWGCWGCVSVGV